MSAMVSAAKDGLRGRTTKGPPPKKTPGDLHNLAQHIIPGSLTSTINIHRQANQDAKIRAVKTDTGFWDRGQFVQEDRRREEPQSDGNRPMSLSSSLSDSFRNKVAEEASKHGLVEPQIRRVMVVKPTGAKTPWITSSEWDVKALHYVGKTYDGHLTKDEGERLAKIRKALLERYETPFGKEVLSEDDWKTQMDILRRARTVTYHKHKSIEEDEDFKLALKYRTVLEHIGKIIPPAMILAKNTPLEPWATSPQMRKLPAMQRMDAEIEAFMDWVDPTEPEQLAREAVFDTTLRLIRDHLPNLSATRMGSQVTGLAMPTSDADIRLYHPNTPPYTLDAAAEVSTGMDVMFDILNSHPAYTATERVGGQYPLVNTTHKETSLSVQIVSSPSSERSRNLVRQSLQEHPHLKALFTIVKTALDMRGLSSVFTGGLGSYTIFNMVLAVLNLYRIEHPNARKPATPATLLMYLFDFYGNRFNPYAFGIASSPFQLFRKRRRATEAEEQEQRTNKRLRATLAIAKPVHLEPYMLCLQDPVLWTNDLGRKSFAFKHVQRTMHHFYFQLKQLLGDKDLQRPLIRTVIGRCDYEYDDRRTKLELFGETCEKNPEPLIQVGPVREEREESEETTKKKKPPGTNKGSRNWRKSREKRREKRMQLLQDKDEEEVHEGEGEVHGDEEEVHDDAIEELMEKTEKRLAEEQAEEERIKEEIRENQKKNEEKDKSGNDDLKGYSPHM
ncbi:hypothetical protein MBLNU457_7284t2 [Dothideomycetes sp. NU457]